MSLQDTLSLNPLSLLCDVVALSKTRCRKPIKAILAYAINDNFIGRPIEGYAPGITDFALMTTKAAEALCEVQNQLLAEHNIGLLIYDSYRPNRAVMDFMQWSKAPVANNEIGKIELARKAIHYPHIEKHELFSLGYLSETSQHCFGHTVDLVLIDDCGVELPLGAPFDYMDKLAHDTTTIDDIGEEAFANRQLLSKTMQQNGFTPYQFEFWHYSHTEKQIHKPMDFPITEALRGLNV